MIFNDPAELKARVKELTGRPIYGKPHIITDTSDYFRIAGVRMCCASKGKIIS